MTETQLTLDGVQARCEYADVMTSPHRDQAVHVLACVLPPHDDDIAHQLEWIPIPATTPRLVVIEGGRL